MNNTEISEALFDSVQVLIDASLNKINYDRTLKYKIKDDTRKSEGIYRVTDGEIEFEAKVTDLNTEYRIDEEVYVTIIQGNFSNDKIIIGRYVENEENKPITYIAPEDQLISDYQIENSLSNIIGVTADKFWISNPTQVEEAETKKVCFFPFNSYNNGYIENDYTRLILGCEFINRLGDYNIIAGNYGVIAGIITSNKAITINSPELELPEVITGENTSLKEIQNYINNQEETDDLQFAIKYITLDSSDMIGNIYNYSQSLSQDIIVDISALQNIVGIYIELYQMNNFKSQGLTETVSLYQIYKNKYDIKDENIPLTNEKHMFYTQEVNNIGIQKVWVKFGYSQQDVEDNTLNLYTQSSLDFTPAGTKLEENQKNIKAKWIHKDNITGKLISVNDLTSIEEYQNKYQVNWYISSYEIGDVYAGFGWTKIKDDDIGLIKTDDPLDLIYTPITDQSEISIKAVLLEKKENNWEAIAQSSILTFKNKNMVSNTSGTVYLEVLDEQKEFYIYGEDFKIINYEDFNKTRTLKATIPETRLGFKTLRIDWIIPRGATMLLDPRDENESDKTKSKYKQYNLGANVYYHYGNSDYCVITKLYELENKDDPVPEQWLKQSFGIQEFYNNTYIRNQITCKVFYDDEYNEYFDEGRINLKFGQTSNNGTNYNFSLLFEDTDHPYVTYNENDKKFEITNGGILTLVPYFSAKNYQLTEEEEQTAKNSIKYEWYYKFPEGYISPISYQKYTDGSGKCLITINENSEISYSIFANMFSNIIKATAKINGVNIETFCSIPIRRLNTSTLKSDPKGIQAPGIITYSTQGGGVQYSTAPLKLYGNVGSHVSEDLTFFIGNPQQYDNSYLTDLQNEVISKFKEISAIANSSSQIDSLNFYYENDKNTSRLTSVRIDNSGQVNSIHTGKNSEHIGKLISTGFIVGESYTFEPYDCDGYKGNQVKMIYFGNGYFYLERLEKVANSAMKIPQQTNSYFLGYTRWICINNPNVSGEKFHLFHEFIDSTNCFISKNGELAGTYGQYDGKKQINKPSIVVRKIKIIEKDNTTDLNVSNILGNRQNKYRIDKQLYFITPNNDYKVSAKDKYYPGDQKGQFKLPDSLKNKLAGRVQIQAEGQQIKVVLRGSDVSSDKNKLNTYFNNILNYHLNADPTIVLKTIPFSERYENTGMEHECVVIKENNKYIQEKDNGEVYLIISNNTIRPNQQYYLYTYNYDYSDSKNFTVLKGGTDIPVIWKLTKLYKPKEGEWKKSEVGISGVSEIGDPEVRANSANSGLWYFRPYPMYITTDTFYQLEAYFKYANNQNYLIWMQPIVIRQNKHFEPILNQWNGLTNITDTHILSPAIGAGSKNEKNEFSGIFMGKVGTNVDDTNAQHGLFGFSEGAEAFGFREDGTAFIGKSGTGRIEFDGNNSTIKSANYEKEKTGIKIDLDAPLFDIKIDNKSLIKFSTNELTLQTENYKSNESGALLDLHNGKIEINGVEDDHHICISNSGKQPLQIIGDRYEYASVDENGEEIKAVGNKGFSVGWDGVATLNGAKVIGEITAGTVGGWQINKSGLGYSAELNLSEGELKSTGVYNPNWIKSKLENGKIRVQFKKHSKLNIDQSFALEEGQIIPTNATLIGLDTLDIGQISGWSNEDINDDTKSMTDLLSSSTKKVEINNIGMAIAQMKREKAKHNTGSEVLNIIYNAINSLTAVYDFSDASNNIKIVEKFNEIVSDFKTVQEMFNSTNKEI